MSQSEVGAVLAAIELERKTVESGDTDLYLSLLTDEAVFMPPNEDAKRGAELHAWLRAFLQDFLVEWLSFDSIEVWVAEDIAYHAYTYKWRVSARAGGEPAVANGKGIHLLRLQPDRSWRIAREIWNSSPASPQ